MSPKILIRIASVVMVLHAAGHMVGMASWNKGETDEQRSVIQAMTDHRFPFMGAVHSFADSLNGFGNMVTVSMILMAILLWMVGSYSTSAPSVSKQLSLVFFLGLFVQSVLEFVYFFPAAAGMTLVSALLTGIFYLLMRKAGA